MHTQFRFSLPLLTLVALSLSFLLSCAFTDDQPEVRLSVETAPPVTAVSDVAPAVAALDYGAAIPAAYTAPPSSEPTTKMADAATILARRQVPILCYHQVRDWREKDSKSAKDYIVPVERFREQMQMLADSGYQTVLPEQLLAYLTTGAPLPKKPVMLTFDDTNLDQYTVAAPELETHGFKGVFFVMTVSLGRPNYMSKAQVKELSDRGHAIGSHTWDHHNVKKYQGQDWVKQIEKPSKQLEAIIGEPVEFFAYPFGLWNPEAIPELKQRGITAAFQLAAQPHPQDPLHSIRRIIASGYWSPQSLNKAMRNSF
ncbi:polysaccharide deacetylase family protein [Pontibacter roseus]|uniref:polysaccharide deacetylase family protein n=1 Tax=Pontibacter roseus TaxID=336989 RepID=UPI000375F5C7|nr:polysaccharide deacetylase family protein [Pontibacter roseus]